MADIKSKLSGKSLARLAEAPKREIYRKIAEKLGVTPSDDTQNTAMDIVQAGADKLGLPKDSAFADAAKAAAVAGMEVFTPDATAAFGPLGKVVARAAKPAATVLKNTMGKAEQVLDYKKLKEQYRAKNMPSSKADADALAAELKNKVQMAPTIKSPTVDTNVLDEKLRAQRQQGALNYVRGKLPTEASVRSSLENLQKKGIVSIK